MISFKTLKRLFWGGRSIDKKTCDKLSCHIKKASLLSAREQIIQYDKIYHHTLKELGYMGTFGEILKRNPKEIKNINEIWELHKVRNSLVHELKKRDEKRLEKQAFTYQQICKDFIIQVKN